MSRRHTSHSLPSGVQVARMYAWSLTRGLQFDIKNSGQHYIFTAHNFRAEWWPSTLKLVFNQNYNKAIAIGAERVMQRIELAIPPQPPKLVSVPAPAPATQAFDEFDSCAAARSECRLLGLEVMARPAYLDRLLELVE